MSSGNDCFLYPLPLNTQTFKTQPSTQKVPVYNSDSDPSSQVRARQIKKKVAERHKSRRPLEVFGAKDAPPRPGFAKNGGNPNGITPNRGVARHQPDSRMKVTTYSKDDAILVVGDGDFTFARGLVKHRSTG